MTVNRSCIYDNNAGSGGYAQGRMMTSGNGGDGGGIFNDGKLTLTLSTISHNRCGCGGGNNFYPLSPQSNTIYPGGPTLPGIPIPIPPFPIPGPPIHYDPTSSGGNGGNGGGIYNMGTLNGVACTIAMNEAGAGGAGAWATMPFYSPPGSTVTGGNGGNGGNGGGVCNAHNASISFTNTIIALNTVTIGGAGGVVVTNETPGVAGMAGLGVDLRGTISSGGFNLVGISDEAVGSITSQATDIVGDTASPIDPMFGSTVQLSDVMFVYTLATDSPALDKGISCGLKTDACGHKRIVDKPNVANATGGDGADIGAVEVQ